MGLPPSVFAFWPFPKWALFNDGKLIEGCLLNLMCSCAPASDPVFEIPSQCPFSVGAASYLALLAEDRPYLLRTVTVVPPPH